MDAEIFKSQIQEVIDAGLVQLSNILPSQWAEKRMVMEKPFPGPFSYDKTPYCRTIIDCFAPDNPAKWIAWKKGAQVGASAGVIIPLCGWIIEESPANTWFTVGSPKLADKAVVKLDTMIKGAQLNRLIGSQSARKRNARTGDTNTKKEFPAGFIEIFAPTNDDDIRDTSLKYGLLDDFEKIKSIHKESGSIRKLIEKRFTAYSDEMKIGYFSSPELADGNIDEVFKMGDQCKYMVPCQCCGVFIELHWGNEVPVAPSARPLAGYKPPEKGGIEWDFIPGTDILIESSVRYRCQVCDNTFKDNNKQQMLRDGYWEPTATPFRPGFKSFDLSCLYSPTGMYDWKHMVYDWLEAHPKGQPRKEGAYQAFLNLHLGLSYEPSMKEYNASNIQKNTRPYHPATLENALNGKGNILPEKLSIADGNGKIVMLTCAADMNGKMDQNTQDVRLDYQIIAHTETGAWYSISHGSIGTFIPAENQIKEENRKDRVRWTYENGKQNCVWPVFDKIREQLFMTDTGRRISIYMTGLDCGHFANLYAYPYLESKNTPLNMYVAGLKGKGEDDYMRLDRDVKYFVPAKERPNLYILEVNKIKDDLAESMMLNWNGNEDFQPFGFMNFPSPSDGQYDYPNFFAHFESEHPVRKANKDGTSESICWKKKRSNLQNHQWDTTVYNIAIREIIVDLWRKETKNPKLTWKDFVLLTAKMRG